MRFSENFLVPVIFYGNAANLAFFIFAAKFESRCTFHHHCNKRQFANRPRTNSTNWRNYALRAKAPPPKPRLSPLNYAMISKRFRIGSINVRPSNRATCPLRPALSNFAITSRIVRIPTEHIDWACS